MYSETEKEYLKVIAPMIDKGMSVAEIIRETGYPKNHMYKVCKLYKNNKEIKKPVTHEVGKKDNILSIPLSKMENPFKDDFCKRTIDDISVIQREELNIAKKFADIINYPKELIGNLQKDYETIGNMNIEMQKLLHDLESCEDEKSLLDVAKKLFLLRRERRVVKNRYRLGCQLRHIFSNNRTHSSNLVNVSDAFFNVIDSIENYKEYNPQQKDDEILLEEDDICCTSEDESEEELSDWQKSVATIMNISEEKSS